MSGEKAAYQFSSKVTLTPQFIKVRNQAFTRKERDILRLALVKQLMEYYQEGFAKERIEEVERLIQKFNNGKEFK